MATQKQIEANRRNAQKSTGPVTDLGKATAKFNSLKHGMSAATTVLPHEDPISFAELRNAFLETYNPANAIEAALVETIANSYWRLLRIRRVETATIDNGIRGLKNRYNASTAPALNDDEAMAVLLNQDDDPLLKIERHQTRIERCYFQAIETLRRLQSQRLREDRHSAAEARKKGFVLKQRAAHTAEAQNAGFPVTETEHATVIHILQPKTHIANREGVEFHHNRE
ncbi:MAG TPA: hypothetical protein VER03_22610 [Bryobacteraceae bacterium]|nr:hypothetical protein [Bryobacteraceae bacterium]